MQKRHLLSCHSFDFSHNQNHNIITMIPFLGSLEDISIVLYEGRSKAASNIELLSVMEVSS